MVKHVLLEIEFDNDNPLRDFHELLNDTTDEYVYALSSELIGATHHALLQVRRPYYQIMIPSKYYFT